MTTDDPAIVCTLDGGPEAMARRIDEWRSVLAGRTDRRPADGGLTLTCPPDPDLAAELARLAAAEVACCSFLTFTLTVGPADLRLTATAPDSGREMVEALFGEA